MPNRPPRFAAAGEVPARLPRLTPTRRASPAYAPPTRQKVPAGSAMPRVAPLGRSFSLQLPTDSSPY